ncbi:uncharacterized protein JN550_012643 [Neoarthrinium moseri]|uniref:uncharacterized protein n=1 Tax=Neoarthrinium moseri TaxID=1658444 RepID=UPI001FDCF2F3|nr:uncharacterized protein JN550_012643 [Neoarthrinium moseri]KAI1858433.1 hypothetical protein JN550_012643 [Neoarthrinium moseri]
MEPHSIVRTVLFDLDNTLFDHCHSLRCAISAVQETYTSLEGHEPEELVVRYNAALQQAYDMYLRNEITYAETDTLKIQRFLRDLGLPEPGPDDIKAFRNTYKPAYRANRRSTPGSIETLTKLRKHGYRLGIVTNGQIEDQNAKVEAIGLKHLVDGIYSSEEAGCAKPQAQTFRLAMDRLGASPHTTLMVGDSVESDVRGALDVGMDAILYAPLAQESQRLLFGQEVPVASRGVSSSEDMDRKSLSSRAVGQRTTRSSARSRSPTSKDETLGPPANKTDFEWVEAHSVLPDYFPGYASKQIKEPHKYILLGMSLGGKYGVYAVADSIHMEENGMLGEGSNFRSKSFGPHSRLMLVPFIGITVPGVLTRVKAGMKGRVFANQGVPDDSTQVWAENGPWKLQKAVVTIYGELHEQGKKPFLRTPAWTELSEECFPYDQLGVWQSYKPVTDIYESLERSKADLRCRDHTLIDLVDSQMIPSHDSYLDRPSLIPEFKKMKLAKAAVLVPQDIPGYDGPRYDDAELETSEVTRSRIRDLSKKQALQETLDILGYKSKIYPAHARGLTHTYGYEHERKPSHSVTRLIHREDCDDNRHVGLSTFKEALNLPVLVKLQDEQGQYLVLPDDIRSERSGEGSEKQPDEEDNGQERQRKREKLDVALVSHTLSATKRATEDLLERARQQGASNLLPELLRAGRVLDGEVETFTTSQSGPEAELLRLSSLDGVLRSLYSDEEVKNMQLEEVDRFLTDPAEADKALFDEAASNRGFRCPREPSTEIDKI